MMTEAMDKVRFPKESDLDKIEALTSTDVQRKNSQHIVKWLEKPQNTVLRRAKNMNVIGVANAA